MNKRFISEMFNISFKTMLRSFLVIGFVLSTGMYSFSQDVAHGKEIFEGQCASCHAINEKLIGPALKDVEKRYDEAWLIKWIRNSQAMVKAGDPIAVKLFNEYNKSVMSAFENLGDGDIKSVLAYIKEAGTVAPAANVVAGGSETVAVAQAPASGGSKQATYILIALAFVLLLGSLVLWRVGGILERLVVVKFPEEAEEKEPGWIQTKFMPWLKSLNLTIAALVVIGLFVAAFGGWFFTYANTEIGVQQDYAPSQPINFSHELHAGQYKIDCQYCHSTASVSKQASVPAVSTCMNCHKYIDAKEKYSGEVSPEIQKVRHAYETNTPVKWVRIHNLPDHAYFNHAQHVSVGKIECQACHGPVETMAKVAQHSSLQMGWCVNCHRESKVDVANNDYYEELHEDLKKHGKRTISVANNGGLDCGKCHY
jgi:mono/diheme cytochrome c family protein